MADVLQLGSLLNDVAPLASFVDSDWLFADLAYYYLRGLPLVSSAGKLWDLGEDVFAVGGVSRIASAMFFESAAFAWPYRVGAPDRRSGIKRWYPSWFQVPSTSSIITSSRQHFSSKATEMFKFAALLASIALASAAPNAIQPRDGCVTAYIESFTLAAYNTTLPNTNMTGAPLVLGQAGAVDGGELFVLSTYASYPYNSYPTLAMSNGVIAATGSDTHPVASAPAAGDELSFAAPLEGDPDHAFCAAWSTDGQYTYELVVEGDAGSWWLCPAQYGQTNVVYKPDQSHGDEYDFDRCYPVRLHIVQ